MDCVQLVDLRVEEYSDRDANGLHVAVGGLAFDLAFTGLNIVDNRFLNYGDLEIVPFPITLRRKPSKFIELDRIMSDIDYR